MVLLIFRVWFTALGLREIHPVIIHFKITLIAIFRTWVTSMYRAYVHGARV